MQNMAPKVLIRTLPLSNGNYGGILQAYALQQVVRALGCEPVTDISRAGVLFPKVKRVIKSLAIELPLVHSWRPNWFLDKVYQQVNELLMEFVERHVSVIRLYDNFGRPNHELTGSFDAMISGSDQVWRRAYGDVKSYLFDFAKDAQIPKISYAASFGLDSIDAEYDEALVAETAVLAKRFDAISVREKSGVRICTEKWGVRAIQLIDPTMLLDVEHYAELAGRAEIKMADGLLSYVLDPSAEAEQWLEGIKRALESSSCQLMPPLPMSLAELRASPGSFRRPSVYAWLHALQQAEYVVTDSFHGTVFSILFERPFLVVKNKKRGSARFDTLLEIFGLQQRAVTIGEDAADRMRMPIDWDKVRDVLKERRLEALDFLKSTLPSTAESRKP